MAKGTKKAQEKTDFEQLKKDLLIQPKHASFVMSAEENGQSEKFCDGYKAFLDEGKTEREAVRAAVKIAESNGYVPFERSKKYKAGSKVYTVNRGKAVILAQIGTLPLTAGLRIAAAHVDAPRLDLKPNPLYEDNDIALLKTHYYGGIRKYQWTATPLALHGVVSRKDGSTVEVRIGEDEADTKLCISDLLPHLAKEQSQRTLAGGITGEELNIIVGSTPVGDEKLSDKTKLNIMRILNEKYGLVESDFLSAELEAVPAAKACDIGLDRSMIGAYGHDDRVCGYTALMAQMSVKKPAHTTVTILADKEEIGSVGATGLNSDYLKNFISNLADNQGVKYYDVVEHSSCFSADVNAAFDPTWASVSEKRNNCRLNCGVVMTKYTGHGGKSGSNDASAEFCGRVRRLFDSNGVLWQIGELGKVDQGGGGTVALYIAGLEMDVVDIGVPVISMHAPFELVAKSDVYMTYKGFKAFFEAVEF